MKSNEFKSISGKPSSTFLNLPRQKFFGMSGRKADVGEHHCPCPVLVSFLSGISGKSCPDSVRILEKKAVRCLSVRSGKGETELAGFSLSLSADVWRTVHDPNISVQTNVSVKLKNVKTLFYDSRNELKCQEIILRF